MSDVMLYGVLRMPYEMALGSELSRYQFYQRVQEAANRLEAAEAELAALKAQPAPTEAQGEDSARMDWIEKHAIKGATYKGITSANVILYEGEWHELGLRAAVDAARARASAETGGVKT